MPPRPANAAAPFKDRNTVKSSLPQLDRSGNTSEARPNNSY
jgi:hypothetical protein